MKANDMTSNREERRASDRHPPKVKPTYVWISLDKKFQARVLDESTGGIAIEVAGKNEGRFEVGFQVRVQHEQVRRTAVVSNVSESDGDRFRVGLAWEN